MREVRRSSCSYPSYPQSNPFHIRDDASRCRDVADGAMIVAIASAATERVSSISSVRCRCWSRATPHLPAFFVPANQNRCSGQRAASTPTRQSNSNPPAASQRRSFGFTESPIGEAKPSSFVVVERSPLVIVLQRHEASASAFWVGGCVHERDGAGKLQEPKPCGRFCSRGEDEERSARA